MVSTRILWGISFVTWAILTPTLTLVSTRSLTNSNEKLNTSTYQNEYDRKKCIGGLIFPEMGLDSLAENHEKINVNATECFQNFLEGISKSESKSLLDLLLADASSEPDETVNFQLDKTYYNCENELNECKKRCARVYKSVARLGPCLAVCYTSYIICQRKKFREIPNGK